MVRQIFAQKNFQSARLKRGGRCFELHCRRAFFVFVFFVFVFLWFRQRAWARSSTASAVYHTCVMSLLTCRLRGETCGSLDAESSDRGANARRLPASGMRLGLRPCECRRHRQARAGKQAQAAQAKNRQAQPSTSRQAGAVKFGQAASFVAPSTSSAFGRMQVPGSEGARVHPFGRQAILCAFADINRLAKQSELCMQLCPAWWRAAGSTLGVIRAHAIAALIRARMCCTQILQLRRVPIG